MIHLTDHQGQYVPIFDLIMAVNFIGLQIAKRLYIAKFERTHGENLIRAIMLKNPSVKNYRHGLSFNNGFKVTFNRYIFSI